MESFDNRFTSQVDFNQCEACDDIVNIDFSGNLPICHRKNINQFKVKLKSIYQNLVETTFDTNNYCSPTLVS
jgi:hypothetical protein